MRAVICSLVSWLLARRAGGTEPKFAVGDRVKVRFEGGQAVIGSAESAASTEKAHRSRRSHFRSMLGALKAHDARLADVDVDLLAAYAPTHLLREDESVTMEEFEKVLDIMLEQREQREAESTCGDDDDDDDDDDYVDVDDDDDGFDFGWTMDDDFDDFDDDCDDCDDYDYDYEDDYDKCMQKSNYEELTKCLGSLRWLQEWIKEGKVKYDQGGATPLHIAAKWGHRTSARVLIELGADIEATEGDGDTPLLAAVWVGEADIVKLLLLHGANVHANSEDGHTPLHIAAGLGDLDVSKLLLLHGANVDARAIKNLTPLHVAAIRGRKKVVDILVANEADLDAEDVNDKIPLEVAADDMALRAAMMDAMQKELATATRAKRRTAAAVSLKVDNLAGYFEGAGASEARIERMRREILSITAAESAVSRKLSFTMGAMLVAALAWWCWERHRNSADRIAADLLRDEAPEPRRPKRAARRDKRQDKKSKRRAEEAEPAPPLEVPPAWPTFLRVMVCCYSLYIIMDSGESKVYMIMLMVGLWTGFQTISDCFFIYLIPRDSTWRGVGGDAGRLVFFILFPPRQSQLLHVSKRWMTYIFFFVPFLFEVGCWLCKRFRARQSYEAMRELLRGDWANRARAAAVAWAEGVLKRDVDNRWFLMLLVVPVAFATYVFCDENESDNCQSAYRLVVGLIVICGAFLLFVFFVEPVTAAIMWACVADRPLEAEPVAGEPVPEPQPELESDADEPGPSSEPEDSDSGSEPEAAAEATVEPTPEPTLEQGTEPPPADEAKSDGPEPAREAKVEEPAWEPAVVVVEEAEAPRPAAPHPESKRDEPVEAVPEGYETVARILESIGEMHLLPLFTAPANQIADDFLLTIDPGELIQIGVPPMVCLKLLGASAARGKAKKIEAEDLLHGVATHQSVLEDALRDHRAEINRLHLSREEVSEDLCCSITCELMKDPVVCVGDGHTYERVAIAQWFASGARTSPATGEELETTALVPNHTVRKLITTFLEAKRRR